MVNHKKRRPAEKRPMENKTSFKLGNHSMFAGSKADAESLIVSQHLSLVSQQLSRDLQMYLHDHTAAVSLTSTKNEIFITVTSEKNNHLAIDAYKKFFSKYNLSLNNDEFNLVSKTIPRVYKVNVSNAKLEILVDTVNDIQQQKLKAAP